MVRRNCCQLGWFRFSSQLNRTRGNSAAHGPATQNGLTAFGCEKPNSKYFFLEITQSREIVCPASKLKLTCRP
jgi:hypothetical protein